MVQKKLKVAITLRLSNAQNYSEKRDALSRDWPIFLEKLDVYPLLVPNSISNVKEFLDEMKPNAIILSGGENIGENPERDLIESSLIEYGINNNLPILGVCRGMQILNHYFGGSISSSKNKNHVDTNHLIKTNQRLGSKNNVQVNSFHDNIILKTDLSKNFEILAECESDQTIEAIVNKKSLLVGVMWHPEREQNEFNLKIVNRILRNDF